MTVKEHSLMRILKKRDIRKSHDRTSCFFGSSGSLGAVGTAGTCAALLRLTRMDPLEFLSLVVS